MATDGIDYMGQTLISSSSKWCLASNSTGGDGHEHGCLDALAIPLSLRWCSHETSGCCGNGDGHENGCWRVHQKRASWNGALHTCRWNFASRRPRLPISWNLLDEWADSMQHCEPRVLQLSVYPTIAKLKLGQKCYVALTFSWDSRRVWRNWLLIGRLVVVGKHRSTLEHHDGLWFLYLRATASDLGSVSECANWQTSFEYCCLNEQ